MKFSIVVIGSLLIAAKSHAAIPKEDAHVVPQSQVVNSQSSVPDSEMPLWKSAKFPVGTTRLKLDTRDLESAAQSITVARFVTDARQELRGSCREGYQVENARCRLTPHAPTGSFDMGFDLNPLQTRVIQPNPQSASCQAVVVRPDQVVQLNLEMKCVGSR